MTVLGLVGEDVKASRRGSLDGLDSSRALRRNDRSQPGSGRASWR